MNEKKDMYDIGDLQNDPWRLYDMCVKFDQVFQCRSKEDTAEIWLVLEKLSRSLWDRLPPVVVIDFRDEDDPATWGAFGSPVFDPVGRPPLSPCKPSGGA